MQAVTVNTIAASHLSSSGSGALAASPAPAPTTPSPHSTPTTPVVARTPSGAASTSDSGVRDSVSSGVEGGQRKMAKLRKLLSGREVDLEELQKLCWHGAPPELRAIAWKLLLNYLPLNVERRQSTLERKRAEYITALPSYFNVPDEQLTEYELSIRHQIDLDVPRTLPTVPLFSVEPVQIALGRILYMWSIRHPGTGYVQGMNDLATPFFVTFLSEHTQGDVASGEVADVSEAMWMAVEADVYWALTKLLDSIQDHYTFAQPGIQMQMSKLQELIKRLDAPLAAHLDKEGIQFVQFAFRWFNCLLVREFPMRLLIRLWDTYLAEGDQFAVFHLYVCASYLSYFSKELLKRDFAQIMMFLQNPPTDTWSEDDLETVLSQAYMWKALFDQAPSHLKPGLKRSV